MLIAYTQEKVVMAGKKEGEEVNVEIDMVGKYVEKSVKGYFEDTGRGRRRCWRGWWRGWWRRKWRKWTDEYEYGYGYEYEYEHVFRSM